MKYYTVCECYISSYDFAEGVTIDEVLPNETPKNFMAVLNKCIRNSLEDGLECYIRNEDLKNKIKKIRLEAFVKDNTLYLCAETESHEDLNETDLENLKKYLSGQYSDGWGEGFEKFPAVLSSTVEYYVSMDWINVNHVDKNPLGE